MAQQSQQQQQQQQQQHICLIAMDGNCAQLQTLLRQRNDKHCDKLLNAALVGAVASGQPTAGLPVTWSAAPAQQYYRQFYLKLTMHVAVKLLLTAGADPTSSIGMRLASSKPVLATLLKYLLIKPEFRNAKALASLTAVQLAVSAHQPYILEILHGSISLPASVCTCAKQVHNRCSSPLSMVCQLFPTMT
ncbi:hypothetical protein MMC07_000377 [Pseudocyphellaria aurata]|nr:hypothetical protein [Pseudocyphellaria aurata]